jgi:putative photosynthetic complex assembly protein 2
VDFVLPVAVAVAAWWISTVVLIYRAGLPTATFRATFIGATAVMLLGAWALVASRDDPGNAGAYLAFLGALAVWGWHEVSYLFGFVSGPRPSPCPPGCRGWKRFVYGLKTCAYHEIAIVATAGLIAAVTWNAANRVGLWTFVILWLMRWSAKLNIFFGVRNFHAEFWPEHLRYLETFVRERPMNGLFPWSVLLAGAGLAVLGTTALEAGVDSARRTGSVLLATLLGLATIEHLFLVLRIPDERLWGAGLRSRRPAAPLPRKAEQRL